MSFTPKPSQATKLWLGILSVVLIALFIETRGTRQGDFNFCLSTDSSAIGAEVFVDGKKVGVISDGSSSGLGGGVFWTQAPRGKHELRIQKENYKPFTTTFEMRNEEYLAVDLQRGNQ